MTNIIKKLKQYFSFNKEQKAKAVRLKQAMRTIEGMARDYIAKNDKQIMELTEYQLVLGLTEILCENEILKAIKEGKVVSIPMVSPQVQRTKLSPEEEFDKPEFLDRNKKGFH